jgi:putative ABC transport system permease protein
VPILGNTEPFRLRKTQPLMYKSYFITAIRNLFRSKVYSLINIAGLSLGLACCMLLVLYTSDELSYDKFHANQENIYRLVATMTNPHGNENKYSSTGMLEGPDFKRQIPEIQDFMRLKDAVYTVKHANEIYEQEALRVDENFFSVFSFPLIQGDGNTALRDTRSIVLSEEVAEKYFGSRYAVGQTLDVKINDTFRTFVVSAVAKRSPQNSSIKIQMLLPIHSTQPSADDLSWLNFFLNTFLTLKPGSDVKTVESKMAKVFSDQAAVQLKDAAEKFGFNEKIAFALQPLVKIHTSADFPSDNGLTQSTKPIYSYILSAIVLFILLIACINFVNLAVARSLQRTKEIGIRKVVGGQRSQLMVQFLGESYILTFIAFVLAIFLVQLLLPFFNTLANKSLSFSYLLDTKTIAGFIAVYLVSGALAGFYPALVMSRFDPIKSLSGNQLVGGSNYLSKGLIVFQFTIAVIFIIATLTIYFQLSYMTNHDLGYNDKGVLWINAGKINKEKLDIFRTELLKNSSIKEVSADQGGREGTIAHINGSQEIDFDIKHIDESYLPLFEIPITKGRNFSKAIVSDSANSILVNEAFVKQAGWKYPIGQIIDLIYAKKKYSVIGVVKDYNFLSLRDKISPELFSMSPQYDYGDVFIRLTGRNTAQALNFVESTFKQIFPSTAYQYNFKDEMNTEQYYVELKLKQIVGFGSALTIFISSIGLFGLSTLATVRRRKEIGIRKVLGASVERIVTELSGDFLKLIVLSVIFASPAAWWAMHTWLGYYAYRISLSWWMFASAGCFVVLVALTTLISQAVKAAISNPVKSLRTE